MYIYSNMSCLSLAQIPKILLSTFFEIAFVSWISLLHFELTSVNIKIIWQRQVLLIPHVVQKHLKFNFIVCKFLKKRGYFTKEGRKDQTLVGDEELKLLLEGTECWKRQSKCPWNNEILNFSQNYMHNRYSLK